MIAPAVVVLAILLLTTLPVWLLLALAASPLVPGHLRVPRLVFLAIVYVVWDAAALVVLAALWVASGFGRHIRNSWFQRAHYVVTGGFLRILFWFARWSLHLTIDVVGTDPDTAIPGRPEIVVSRHAGPGDSFVLIHALVNWFDREPRIVLKATLQWDPAVDVLLNRLPNRFISPGSSHSARSDPTRSDPARSDPRTSSGRPAPRASSDRADAGVSSVRADSHSSSVRADSHSVGADSQMSSDRVDPWDSACSPGESPEGASRGTGPSRLEREVGELARGLDENDAFVIFPEGGNFTPRRRVSAIARLRARGLSDMAAKAEKMRNLLPPKPGGLLRALDEAPDAGVIFVAHTGLERMMTVGDVWRELPMDKRLIMRFWSVPPEEIPVGEQERTAWLYEWWARIDAWIDENRPVDHPLTTDWTARRAEREHRAASGAGGPSGSGVAPD